MLLFVLEVLVDVVEFDMYFLKKEFFLMFVG